jgi:hypothetical protein
MTTNRTPIQRPALTMISPRAVELFEAMGKLRCTCAPRDWNGKYWKHQQCAGCARWYDFHDELHRELGCEPWQWPCVSRQGRKRAGSPCWNDEIAARMAMLDEAVRRRTAVSARKEEESTHADPAGQDATST